MLLEAAGAFLTYFAIIWGFFTWLIRDVLSGFTQLAIDATERWRGDEVVTQAAVASEVQQVASQPKDAFGALSLDDKLKAVAKDSRNRIDEVRTEMQTGFAELTRLIQSLMAGTDTDSVDEDPTDEGPIAKTSSVPRRSPAKRSAR
jgi:hypothetical protein